MAKGKTSSGRHYTSKGLIGTNRSITKQLRRERHPADIENAKFDAFLKGKNVYFTIDNPNHMETNKRKIRVTGRTLYGDPKEYLYGKREKAK